MPESAPVLVVRDGHVTTLSLNAPARRNALSMAMREALADGLAGAMNDPACRVIVPTGEGGHFCAGGDIAGMGDAEPVAGRHRLRSAHAIIRLLVEGEKPVVVAVEGHAAGAGLSLACACDVVVAGADARFACSFNRLGLVPDFGLAHTLPMRVGTGRARRIMLGGDAFGAEAAERWGLVDEVAEAGGARAAAAGIAGRIVREAAPLSNAFAKRLLARMPGSLDDILRAEAESQSILYASRDFAEGRAAFLEKRKPRFEGR